MFLRKRGIFPKIHMMDNNCPKVVKAYLRNNKAELQFSPLHMYRTNGTEKSISIFKDHFISVLLTVNPDFPFHLWCWLITLSVTTLNLLQPLQINPCIYVYELLNGVFNYNKTPL